MSDMMYREEQRVPWKDLLFFAAVFGGLLMLALVQILMGKDLQLWDTLILIGVGVVIVAAIWLLNAMRMTIRITDKNLKLTYQPLRHERRKIKWKHVRKIELVRLPRYYKWRGWNVHYSSGNKWYNLSGKSILKITMKDGSIVLVGCKDSNAVREALKEMEKTRGIVTKVKS